LAGIYSANLYPSIFDLSEESSLKSKIYENNYE